MTFPVKILRPDKRGILKVCQVIEEPPIREAMERMIEARKRGRKKREEELLEEEIETE